ncbi:uncharacterized protein IL334_002191 [Kwoniella shivajii]|uniref:Defect at low temperature protein 1 n=1 Tax=Kwoniella shivajii TaxID=564305 RepID=A0ABZ1CUN7_9TREE|nr:hypothetical protein IL334_002191 [Kwoniella shivajii]
MIIQILIALGTILLFLLSIPLVRYIYLNVLIPLITCSSLVLISIVVFYPIYFIYINSPYVPQLVNDSKVYVLTLPRKWLWNMEFYLHIRTRDIYPNSTDQGPPYPLNHPHPEPYNRISMIRKLCWLWIKQSVWDLFGIPYGYYAEQNKQFQLETKERQKELGLGDKTSGKFTFGLGMGAWRHQYNPGRSGENSDNDTDTAYHVYDDRFGPNNQYSYNNFTSPPPYDNDTHFNGYYTQAKVCSCTTTCPIHTARYTLQIDTLLPTGTIVIPPPEYEENHARVQPSMANDPLYNRITQFANTPPHTFSRQDY